MVLEKISQKWAENFGPFYETIFLITVFKPGKTAPPSNFPYR